MSQPKWLALCVALCLALVPAVASAAGPEFTHGAPGIGDPYFPYDGNGGYDVQHYALDLGYDPASDVLTGRAVITAVATQGLSRFNLDFDGLNVRSITVNDRAARWSRDEGELRVTPRRGLPAGSTFVVVIAYDGVPVTFDEPSLGVNGFFHTDDGALVLGQPHAASAWFPVNDHPLDKASYTFDIRVPAGLEAVANGSLLGNHTTDGWTTWTWDAPEPMASYLAMMQIGEFDLRAYKRAGIRYWDAIDPDLGRAFASPRSGSHYAASQPGDAAYKRLATTISVPAGGAILSFWLARSTEDWWDFVAVEAHHPGSDDWTTLPDLNGHTGQDGGGLCLYSSAHPFLAHYMTADWTDPDNPACVPTGTTGTWHAATGASDGYEPWSIDLGAYAGGDVEVAISYITDEIFQLEGLFVDDVVVTTGQGSTDFEAGSLAPWTVPGAPDGSPGNETDWIAATEADIPTPVDDGIEASFGRQQEMIRLMAGSFGPYPFATSGGVVDDYPGIGFALETQTRPVYSRWFFQDATGNDFVVVHELAHMWYGDSVAVARWQDIWLNEGFASYAEFLWNEHEGWGTPQEIFDWNMDPVNGIPPDDPFWELAIGDPGPDALFWWPVYLRGALTLQALRQQVGDVAFFDILETWATEKADGNATTPEFIALCEQISGQDLDALFDAWLSAGYPLPIAATAPSRQSMSAQAQAQALASAPPVVRSLYERYGKPRDGRAGH